MCARKRERVCIMYVHVFIYCMCYTDVIEYVCVCEFVKHVSDRQRKGRGVFLRHTTSPPDQMVRNCMA